MNKLGITTTALAMLGSTTYALAENQLDTTLDLMIRGMMDSGNQVSYDDKIVGADGSVEFKNLVIAAEDQSMTIAVDWLKGVPSADDPEVVTFTTADTISVTAVNADETVSFDIVTQGMEFTTNAVLRAAMSNSDISATFLADSFRLVGGDPESAVLRKLDADLGAVSLNLLALDAEHRVEGDMTFEKFDAIYDITMQSQTQKTEQTSGPVSVSFGFDVPESDQDAVGYLDGTYSAFLQMESGASTFKSSIDDSGLAVDMAGTSTGGTALIKMEDGTFVYDTDAGGFDMTVTPGPGVPIPPVDLSLSKLVMRIVAPLNSADAPEKSELLMTLSDLEVGEGLWSMIDPGKTIPRDPATLNIDLSAMIQVDPLALAAGADPMVAMSIHTLDVNQILLDVAGAKANVDGALTFNNDGPIPMPLGNINIELVGINGLTDKLVALGLLDQMQAGMTMGMIMAFGKPGDMADQFLSEISFTENGILANGQPIQ